MASMFQPGRPIGFLWFSSNSRVIFVLISMAGDFASFKLSVPHQPGWGSDLIRLPMGPIKHMEKTSPGKTLIIS